MNFQKFVKRSTKGLLLFIVIVMTLTLVLWGYGGSLQKEEEDAGVIFGTVRIPQAAYNDQCRRAVPAYWWNQYREFGQYIARGYYRPQNPKVADVAQQAWQRLVLLEEARRRGFAVTEPEVQGKMEEACRYILGDMPNPPEGYLEKIALGYYHAGSLTTFHGWASDQVLIDKLIDLVTGGEFADYSKVYDEVFKQQQVARAWVAAVDPKESFREPRPVQTEDVLKHYEKNKARFLAPGKIQVTYLLLEVEPLKKKAAEHSEDEVRKYYEGNREEFAKEQGEPPAEGVKKEREYRPLAEVRAEVVEKIKVKKAKDEVYAILDRVNSDLGSFAVNDKYPENVFDKVKEKYKAEGVELVHDVTGVFGPGQVEEIEKIVGEKSSLATWGFEAGREVGEISGKCETSKGGVFFRIQKKIDAYDPGLTEPVRERIVKELQAEQHMSRASRLASKVEGEINARGFAAARRKYALEWRPTRYFSESGETGLDDPGLSGAVAQKVSRLEQGRAVTFPGQGEKKDVTYVLYLEDAVNTAPRDVEGRFEHERSRMDLRARKERKRGFVDALVAEAKVQVAKKEVEKEEPPEEP